MFSWFGKKKVPEPPSHDSVWLSSVARADALARLCRESEAPVLLIAFFEETARLMKRRLALEALMLAEVGEAPASWRPGVQVTMVLAERLRDLVGELPSPLTIIVAERHPLPSENHALLASLALRTEAEPVFHSALDEPLMRQFNGDRITAMAEAMGMTADEPIEHKLVSQALEKGRDKIGKMVRNPQPAASMAEWLERNVGQRR